jgi:RNA polymerase sigma-70 factor (ECF subfamily)
MSIRPPTATETDEALVARVAAGDEDAFAELYRRHMPGIRAFTRRRTGDAGRAEELAQEIFLDVWRSARRFDPHVAPVPAWLRTIAARRAVDWARRSAARPPLAQFEGGETTVEAWDTDRVRRLDVKEALRELPDAQRETLVMAFYGDLSYPEIAEETGTPLGTIKSRALLGMRRLAALQAGTREA